MARDSGRQTWNYGSELSKDSVLKCYHGIRAGSKQRHCGMVDRTPYIDSLVFVVKLTAEV